MNHFDVPTFPEIPLQPGEEGWWQVWGARAYHAMPGDRLVSLDDNGALRVDDIVAVEDKVAFTKFTTTDGSTFTYGNLFPKLTVMRYGTHHTLARGI